MKGRELRAFLVERDGPRCHWCRRPTYDPAEVGKLADRGYLGSAFALMDRGGKSSGLLEILAGQSGAGAAVSFGMEGQVRIVALATVLAGEAELVLVVFIHVAEPDTCLTGFDDRELCHVPGSSVDWPDCTNARKLRIARAAFQHSGPRTSKRAETKSRPFIIDDHLSISGPGTSAVAETDETISISLSLQVISRHLSRTFIGDHLIGELLALVEVVHSGALDGGDMDEDVLLAIIGLDEAKALFGVEPLNSAGRHSRHLAFRRSITGRGQWRSVWVARAVHALARHPATAIDCSTPADLHQLHEREWPFCHLGLKCLAKGAEIDGVVRNGGLDPAQRLLEDGGAALGAERDGDRGSAWHEMMPGKEIRSSLWDEVVERHASQTKGPTTTTEHVPTAGASHVWVRTRVQRGGLRVQVQPGGAAVTRLLGRITWGLVALVIWWLPTILLALAAIVCDRIRFKAVLAWARVLRLCGRRDAARRVYDAALRRTMIRCQKLADRSGR